MCKIKFLNKEFIKNNKKYLLPAAAIILAVISIITPIIFGYGDGEYYFGFFSGYWVLPDSWYSIFEVFSSVPQFIPWFIISIIMIIIGAALTLLDLLLKKNFKWIFGFIGGAIIIFFLIVISILEIFAVGLDSDFFIPGIGLILGYISAGACILSGLISKRSKK